VASVATPVKSMVEPSLAVRLRITSTPATSLDVIVADVKQGEAKNVTAPVKLKRPFASAVGDCVSVALIVAVPKFPAICPEYAPEIGCTWKPVIVP